MDAGLNHFRNPPSSFYVILILLACACAPLDFMKTGPGNDYQGRFIDRVPFFRQSEDDCGPAALASVLSYFGKDIAISDIKAAVYTPALRGSLPMDMERYARSTGLEAGSMKGSLDVLRSYIDRNIPVICLIDLGFWVYRRPHYVTVIGYDNARRSVFMHDGIAAGRAVSYDSFEHTWRRAGNWMLVVGTDRSKM